MHWYSITGFSIKNAKTFRAMLPCYPGFFASEGCPADWDKVPFFSVDPV